MDPWYSCSIGVSIGIVSGIAYYYYRGSSQSLCLLQNAPSFDQRFENLKLKVQSVGTLPYAAVSGKVVADNGILVSHHNSDITGVIQRRTISELKTVWNSHLNNWYDRKNVISNNYQTQPFSIALDGDSSFRIEVTEPLEADVLQLTMVSNEYKPTTSSTAEILLNFANGEHVKGIEAVEEMLPLNTTITAVGQICTSNDGRLVMKPPCVPACRYILAQDSVEHIIKTQKSGLRSLKIFVIVTAFLSSAFLSYWIYKHFIRKCIENRRFKKLRDELLKNNDNTESDDTICLICVERPRDVVILTCGHVCSCKQCTEVLISCPICRSNIDRYVPIYHS